MNKLITVLALSGLLAAVPVAAQTDESSAHGAQAGHVSPAEAKGVKITPVYQHELSNVPGKSVKGVLVEYEPGGINASHTHAPSAHIYATVLEGAVLNQLNGGPVRKFRAGENFTELSGDFHNISANASQTEPAKLLAVFVVDTDDVILTTPATAAD